MNPGDLAEELADARLSEATTLLDAARYAGAYYLAGDAVELTLKARASREFGAQLSRSVLQPKGTIVDLYVHNAEKLIRDPLVNIPPYPEGDIQTKDAWAKVKTWSQNSRYTQWTVAEAETMVTACALYVTYIRSLP